MLIKIEPIIFNLSVLQVYILHILSFTHFSSFNHVKKKLMNFQLLKILVFFVFIRKYRQTLNILGLSKKKKKMEQ